MGTDASVLAGLGTIFAAVLAFFGKVLLDERAVVKSLAEKHEECMENHAVHCEMIGGLKETVRILTQAAPEPVRKEVHAVLADVEVKAEARVEAKKNGNGHTKPAAG